MAADPPSEINLEDILANLLVPDNAVIKQATTHLSLAFKDPGFVPALCNVINTSTNPQVRQYGAVVLRRRIGKKKQWMAISQDVKDNIHENLLQVFVSEPEKTVRHALSQLVGTIAKHDLPHNAWPQLWAFLQEFTKSTDPAQRELGMMIMSTLSGSATESLEPHIPALLALLNSTLFDTESSLVPFFSIQTLTHLVCIVSDPSDVKQFQNLFPHVLQVIRALLTVDEEQACEALEIFDELMETEVAIVLPHIKSIIEFCLEIAANEKLSNAPRVRALSHLSWVISLKKKTIKKHKLVPPMLGVIFPLMCVPPEDEEEEEDMMESDELSANTPQTMSAQVIDNLALHLPPESLIPNLMVHVQPALSHEDPYVRKAAYTTLAVACEGCADHIRQKYLKDVLECVCRGITDNHKIVRHAALFALGQFSEHLQPDISKYSEQILPLLFNYLAALTSEAPENQDLKGINKTFYALEMFCESLARDINPYLPELMNRLFAALNPQNSVKLRELGLSAVAATANAAGEDLLPYFNDVMDHLKIYLISNNDTTPDFIKLQTQAVDTLGMLARTIGKNNFMPLAEECIQLGLKLISELDDPDLRRCTYGLFASISYVLEESMGKYLPTIVKLMIESLKSTEGYKEHYAEEEDSAFFSFADEEETGEEDLMEEPPQGVAPPPGAPPGYVVTSPGGVKAKINGDGTNEEEEEIVGYSVENAYLDEKEDTCCAMGELATNCKGSFMPFLNECFKEVWEMVDYPSPGIKKAAIAAIGQFCCSLAKVTQSAQSEEGLAALHELLSRCLPKFFETIEEDQDRHVVMTTLETLKDMVSVIQTPLLDNGVLDRIIKCLLDVLQGKTACQGEDSENDDCSEEDQEAEYDKMLVECAGEVIPELAKAAGGQPFLAHLGVLLPPILAKLQKRHASVADRSFVMGTIGEIGDAMGTAVADFVPTFYPIVHGGIKDEDEEVRSNAVYALGVLAACGGDAMFSQYSHIIHMLFNLLQKEKDGRTIDNICGAACRMIIANIKLVPVGEVFPMVVSKLPLKDDLEENKTVFECVTKLYHDGNLEVMKHMPQLILVGAQILQHKEVKESGKSVVSTFFREIHGKYPSQLAEVVSGLPQDLQETLTVAIHGVPSDPAPNSNVAPLVAPPSITTTITTTPAPGIETNSSNNNNDGDLSPSDNGEQVETA